ncbi:MAG: WbqC family protein [Anaerolineae bacterium]|jgi:hypothetical protein|nr:WbqC family protein [Anaerolineae bacterium]
MGKKVAIIQSNYIPWKGYFDIIRQVDEFMLFDEAQYTRRDWRNRNKIKTAGGLLWLTIPVQVKGKFHQRIDETLVTDRAWVDDHLKTLRHHYSKAPAFRDSFPLLEDLYRQVADETYLSRINYRLLRGVCDLLHIRTPITWSTDYQSVSGKTDRLISLCQQCGAEEYISGPGARAYMDEALFAQHNLRLTYMDYSGYPEYPQLYPPFEHAVSIVDVLLNTGAAAPAYIQRGDGDGDDYG